jgi:hypothetical protein
VNLLVQAAGALQVVPERLFDDDVCPTRAAVQSGLPQLLDDGGIERGRRGQVEEVVALCAGLGAELCQPLRQVPVGFRIPIVAGQVGEAVLKGMPQGADTRLGPRIVRTPPKS